MHFKNNKIKKKNHLRKKKHRAINTELIYLDIYFNPYTIPLNFNPFYLFIFLK